MEHVGLTGLLYRTYMSWIFLNQIHLWKPSKLRCLRIFFLWCSQAVPHRHIVARWQVEVDPAEVEVSEPEPPPMLVQSQSHRNQCHLETCDEMWLHMIWIATNTLYVRIHNYITLHYATLHYTTLHYITFHCIALYTYMHIHIVKGSWEAIFRVTDK